MLNKETRNALAQLSMINNSVIISYPITNVVMQKTVVAFLDLRELGEEEFEDIGVYNISEFNSVIDVIEDPEIVNDNGTLTIKNDSTSIVYGTANIAALEEECKGNPELLDRIKSNELLFSFELENKDLENTKKMSSLLKELSDLVITADGDSVTLTVKSPEKSSNTFSFTKPCEIEIPETIKVAMTSVQKLPAGDYKVSLYRSKKGSMVLLFSCTSMPGLDIMLSAKAPSAH